MKKYLAALLFLLSGALPVYAQDTVPEEDTNVFGYPDKTVVAIIEQQKQKTKVAPNPKPACDDETVLRQVRETLRPYISTKGKSIAEKRRSRLLMKNIDDFTELNVDDVMPKTYPQLAGRMIELRINNALTNHNFKICQSNSPELKVRFYLLMYDDGANVKVDIINFSRREIPNFVVGD